MRPDAPEVRALLRRCRVVRIATLSPRGWPLLTPLWFVCHRGRIYMGLRADSPAARNAAANPEVTLLFEEENAPHPKRLLRIRGRAALRSIPELRWRLYPRLGLKYFLSSTPLRHFLANLDKLRIRRRYYAERAGEGAFLEVEPTRAELVATGFVDPAPTTDAEGQH